MIMIITIIPFSCIIFCLPSSPQDTLKVPAERSAWTAWSPQEALEVPAERSAWTASSPQEALKVPAKRSAWTASSTILEDGVVYEITAEGCYTSARAGQQFDAEWGPESDPGTRMIERTDQPSQDLLIDDQQVDWLGTGNGSDFSPHTYSPTHVYKVFYRGRGKPVRLKIADTNYRDNKGFLKATIVRSS